MVYKFVQNDTKPDLEFNITKDGVPIDLTSSTVKFYMKNSDTGAVKINGVACTITDYLKGLCKYTWQTGDLDTAGNYSGEVEITFGDGSKETGYKTINLTVRDDI